jgi:hypothetical protein
MPAGTLAAVIVTSTRPSGAAARRREDCGGGGSLAGVGREWASGVPNPRLSDDLSGRQLDQLTKVWNTALGAVQWRESLRYEMGRALANGRTLEHLVALTGFDHQTFERLQREPHNDFNGRHPTDPHAPGQEKFR